MTQVWTIVRYGFEEALRRKVFLVVLVLSVAFLALYAVGSKFIFDTAHDVNPPAGVDTKTVVGATLFGLSMFATLFLGVVLAVFLTLGVVRGDAERGLLQPLVVRPVGRPALLLDRFAAAATVSGACALYQDGLSRIVADQGGITGFVLELGPFGGSQGASAAITETPTPSSSAGTSVRSGHQSMNAFVITTEARNTAIT